MRVVHCRLEYREQSRSKLPLTYEHSLCLGYTASDTSISILQAKSKH